MPSIHPSEDPALGWLVPCLAVKDLEASMEWYARLDLLPYGGDPKQGWSMLRNRAVEIHLFQGHIPKDILNFRGGDLPAIRQALASHGIEPTSLEAPISFTVLDPDGREVFFDTSPEETADYAAGKLTTIPFPGDDVHGGDGLDLGNLTCCLACEDLQATLAWYEKLGLVQGGGEKEQGWAIVARRDHVPSFGTRLTDTYLSLFQGMIPKDILNLRGGNVGAIAEVLAARGMDLGEGVKTGADGGESLLLEDPDGRGVFLDTTPPERLYAN